MQDDKLPEFLRQYFWDVEFADLSIKKAPNFILKRVIDRGDTKAYRWAKNKFTLEQMRELVVKSRDLSRKTADFWAKAFNLDPSEVPCLRKPYSRIPFGV